jgi:hypothetical protein
MQGAITSNNQEHHPCEGQHEGGRECREQVSRQHSKAKYDRHITDEGEQHDIPSSPVLVPAVHSHTIQQPRLFSSNEKTRLWLDSGIMPTQLDSEARDMSKPAEAR